MSGQRLDERASGMHVDERVRATELLISRLLRIGVFSSFALVVLGSILVFVDQPALLGSSDLLGRMLNKPSELRSLAGVLDGLVQLQGRAIVMLGLLVLIATPVLRVLISTVLFAQRRDRTFVVITSLVLTLLLLSFVLGAVAG